ncbi:MAG: glycerol-3-phosphate dehydrogenase/oxidase [Pseudomonadales bacterium]|nr:glycerol-3-phosphate dehydrogenase/oxidase [Pseudomonadales bacterium]
MNNDYDILVIGAGIHGAGVLQAAAAHGYSCLLLEQHSEPALGTSSRSSKLIHGGLRYLETGDFRLVFECLRERKLLLRNAPSLVKLKPFVIPVYQTSQHSAWQIRLGLSLYSMLAGLGKNVRFKCLEASSWQQFPGLKQTGLEQVYQYADAQTDDGALTRAVLSSARSLGAEIRYNVALQQVLYENQAYRVNVVCKTSGLPQTITVKSVVNAAGPQVNQVMDLIRPQAVKIEIEWVRGSHIILPGPASEYIYYLESPRDQRAVFVMPWQGRVLIGTTEQIHDGNPDEPSPEQQEISYLLDVFNLYFPQYYGKNPATEDMIVNSFAGLRVLPKDGQRPFQRSRETRFAYDNEKKPQLLAIYGGKLTSYRATAEKVIHKLAGQLPKRQARGDTRRLSLRDPDHASS